MKNDDDVYRSSPLKRVRRTRDVLNQILEVITAYINEQQGQRITVRHVCYWLASHGIIEKTEHDFALMSTRLAAWRKRGELPFDAFIDETRRLVQPVSFANFGEAMAAMRNHYRRDLWQSQRKYVEVWVEKLAVSGFIEEVTRPLDVGLLPVRGFNSLTTEFEASERFNRAIARGKKPVLLYLSDYDPSGQQSVIATERKLAELFDCPLTIKRIAITREQIVKWKLPGRPTKRSTHAGQHWRPGEESVELDAARPQALKAVVGREIKKLIDSRAWKREQALEAKERRVAARYRKQ